MSILDGILQQVKNAIVDHSNENGNYNHDSLLNSVDNIFGQHRDSYRDSYGNVRPASEDPYGDPAYQNQQYSPNQYGNVRPASEDPYGDPADQYGNVRPASEDPYGDPADRR